MGRVAAALAAAALGLAGCGERAEPVDTVGAAYPLTVGGTVVSGPVDAARATDTMALLLAELGVPRKDNGRLRLAWETDDPIPPGAETPTYVAPARTLDDVARGIADIGLLTGQPAAARRIVTEIERARDRVRTAVGSRGRVRVFVDLGFYATAGDRTLIGAMLREAGGENVAGATPEPGPFPVRQLVDKDPQVYVISSASRTTEDDLRTHPRLRKMAAVRDDRIVVVPDEALTPGPRVAEALLTIARALHPDAFR